MQNRLIDKIISPGEDLKSIVFNAVDKKLYVNGRGVEEFPDMYLRFAISEACFDKARFVIFSAIIYLLT